MNIIFNAYFICIIVTSGILTDQKFYGDNISQNTILDQEEYENSQAFIRKFWGIQDVTTSVGKLFHYKIPADAFAGKISHYEVEETERKNLPKWLMYDIKNSILEGVPSVEDIGDTEISVKAFDSRNHFASDLFTIEVFPIIEKNTNTKKKCKKGQDVVMMWIIIDKSMKDIPPISRVGALKNLAHFLGINYNTLLLLPEQYNIDLHSDAFLIAGQGDIKHLTSNSSSILTWQVGCNEKIWPEKLKLVDSVKQYAKEGTLSDVLELPVAEWRIISSVNPFRGRRHSPSTTTGSPKTKDDNSTLPDDDEDYDDGDEDEELDNDQDGDDEPTSNTSLSQSPSVSPAPTNSTITKDNNGKIDRKQDSKSADNVPIKGTPVKDKSPSRSKLVPDLEEEEEEEGITEDSGTIFDIHSSASERTGASLTTTATSKSTPPLVPITPMTTKPVPVPQKRTPPSVLNKLPVITTTAGKSLEYEIPDDTFIDDDGSTRKLKLSLIRTSPETVYWIQLNPKTQTIYLLPLENQISKWEFEVEAKDSDNMTARCDLVVIVQNPKDIRPVNFEMALHYKLFNDTYLNIDNESCDFGLQCYDGRLARQHRLLNALATVYGDPDAGNISVRSVSYDPFIFAWTNDTLPRDNCDQELVVWLLNTISTHKWSDQLKDSVKGAIGYDITVEKLSWEGTEECNQLPPARPTKPPLTNFHPILRNPIPPLDAYVGQLFVYRIPADTFYDTEDGNTRSMKLTLLMIEHTSIPPQNWLQFDPVNQEIYGLPLSTSYNTTGYQLVSTDKGNLKEIGIVKINIIEQSPSIYNVEFSMQIDTDYIEFMTSALKQRQFVERLARVFDTNDTSSIVIENFSPGSVFVIWHNKTLPMYECAESTILSLKQALLTDQEKVTDQVIQVMQPDFPILGINVTPTMICEGGLTELHNLPEGSSGGRQEIHATIYSSEYFATFILPAVIVAIMIFLAGLIACILYSRRRKGKLSLADDERRSFRKKNIPVIFQDELEERLEPTNKRPIILKDEKPPSLPPPEYQKSPPMATTALLSDFEHPSSYHVSQPGGSGSFKSNRSSGRSSQKQTPIYRKPPPYVPP